MFRIRKGLRTLIAWQVTMPFLCRACNRDVLNEIYGGKMMPGPISQTNSNLRYFPHLLQRNQMMPFCWIDKQFECASTGTYHAGSALLCGSISTNLVLYLEYKFTRDELQKALNGIATDIVWCWCVVCCLHQRQVPIGENRKDPRRLPNDLSTFLIET
ncbi:hypothetical protein ARMSODRAFT_449095 [Armillaria solidipes]|uniref:Uncharacterized protein n=1 Tax=Armillaria solidipes TaxID=1076256 RepID=A0A2H3BM63_9AGAR|nr:hypothetical protein ARMSODRAFT_449095 [Armillaria solidipes]